MTTRTLLTPEITALVGRELWAPETAFVRAEDVLRYHEAVGDTEIRYDCSAD